MKKIPAPVTTVRDVLNACIPTFQNQQFAATLATQLGTFTMAETSYAVGAAAHDLYLVAEQDPIPGPISAAEMSAVYSNSFVRKGGPGRQMYEALKSAAPLKICPLCNQRVVKTLDHYLPKARHPLYALTPLNMVPSCFECNVISREKRVGSKGAQTFHPFFDYIDNEVWLVARIVEVSPPVANFAISAPYGWDPDFTAMATSHLEVFGLNELYGAHASAELVNIYSDLINSPMSSEEVRAHLLGLSERRRWPHKNTWQAALYLAASESDWFVEGGYLEVAY